MTKSKSSRPTKTSISSTQEEGKAAAPESANDIAKKPKSELLEVSAAPGEGEPTPAARGSRKQKLDFEGTMSRSEAVAQLDAIVKGLEKGKIELQAKGQTVELSPSHHYDIELKAATKGSKERISIELSWRADCEPDQKLKVIVDSKES